jgi:hypothetical protein
MLERYFVKPSTVDRIRGNWLAPEIERYVEWMALQGYAIRNVHRRVPILCQFAEFAKLRGATDLKSAVLHIEEFASNWLVSHGSQCTVPAARSKVAEDARNPVRQMLRLHVHVNRTSPKAEEWRNRAAPEQSFDRLFRAFGGLHPK